MKTEVETFILNDSRELIYDNAQLDKWRQIVDKLNLRGQQQIVRQGMSPIPFLLMNDRLTSLLETLCPRKAALEEYNQTPIPVEVLDLAALSHQEGYFDKIQIWYDDQTEDPICVGLCYVHERDRLAGNTWNMNRYLIGRWGEVKSDFEQLKQKARRLYRERRVTELERTIRAAQRELEDIDKEVVEKIG
ncbi:MAG: hypothetical protein U0X91_06555 [Spirosomataceae bacterium]